MIGRGVLLESLADPYIEEVLVINRSPINIHHPKIREVILEDFFSPESISEQLRGYDACLFCLGVSATGMSETEYHRITHDMTLGFAREVLRVNPEITFCYISGAGTDSTETGRMMWARVKGKTENDLLKLGFRKAYMFRPGYIQPRDGIRSRTRLYNILYFLMTPFYPLLRLMPGYVTDTKRLGKALLQVLKHDPGKSILESADINRLVENSK